MEAFCQHNQGVSFIRSDKVGLNGKNAHARFTFLKSERGGLVRDSIKWNFSEFVLDKSGRPVHSFTPTTKQEKMERLVE